MINNYCHTPFNARFLRTILVTYEGPKVHSVVLSSVHLRSASLQSARWQNIGH